MKQTGDIFLTALIEDIKSVFETTDKSRVLNITATIHTEKEDFRPMKVLLTENKRDYLKETGESFHIRVLMPAGDYFWRVLPFRDNLEISVTTSFMFEGGDKNENKKPLQIRYKALLNTLQNPMPTGDSIANKENKELNHLPPMEINFELVDRREELFRLKTISGVYRNHTPEQMLSGVLFNEANKVKVDGKGILSAVELDPPDKKTPIPDLLLPSGLLLRDLPGYMQEKLKGVYTAGIGSFFQWYKNQPTFFIYPLYRPSRFEENDREKLVIYSVPEDKLPTHDHTFRTEGKTIYVITTGSKKLADHASNTQLNQGTGFRLSDVEAVMKKPVEINESGIIANRRKLNHEVSNGLRKDQIAFAPDARGSNPYMEYSKILAQDFQGLSVSWENSDPDLLYPGMPVKFVSMEKGKYTERKGTLVKVFNIGSLIGNPTLDTIYRNTSQLFILVEPENYLPDNDVHATVQEYAR